MICVRTKTDLSEFVMNKKNIGVSFGTILWLVLSFFAAVIFWLFVEYGEATAALSYISSHLMLN